MKRLLIVVDSKNDLTSLTEARRMLRAKHIKSEVLIISSHRNIKQLVDQLNPNDLKRKRVGVVLAIAHSVANLPAIIAGLLKDEPIVVIGVGNVRKEVDTIESLLSVISIPIGIPILNCGIGKVGIHNAILSCIKILQK